MTTQNENQVHVTPRPDGKWQVMMPGNSRASFVAETKQQAVARGRELAKKNGLELVPHKKDGTVSNPNSYGNDPTPPRDEQH